MGRDDPLPLCPVALPALTDMKNSMKSLPRKRFFLLDALPSVQVKLPLGPGPSVSVHWALS